MTDEETCRKLRDLAWELGQPKPRIRPTDSMLLRTAADKLEEGK